MSSAAEAWPPEHLEQVESCPVCGSDERTELHRGLVDNTYGTAPGSWRMERCAGCGSAYLDPRPDRQSIALAYRSYYTHAARPTTGGGWLRRVVLSSAFGYLNARYGLKREPASAMAGILCRMLPPFRGYLDAMMRHLPPVPDSGGELLDIGCGHGAFLDLANEAGWKVRGVDFDVRAVEAASSRGVDVVCGGIEVFAEEHERYDYITSSHVIEHVHDPIDQLRRMLRLLKPGGRVWIETPNIDAQGHRRFGSHWRGLEAPRHLSVFSEPALHGALERVGFVDVRRLYRGAIAPLVYAESHALSCGQPLGKLSLFEQPILPMLAAALLEEFAPGRREFITVSAERPV